MINRKLILVLALVALALLCAVACIMVLNVPREEHVVTIEFPSGDKIIFKYYWDDFLSAYAQSSGGLKYDIYSGQSHTSGQLTSSRNYDCLADGQLTYEIQGERRVKIEDARAVPESWIFAGDSSGKYEVIKLGRRDWGQP